MHRLRKNSIYYIFVIFIILAVTAVYNQSYIICGLFIASLIAGFILVDPQNLYEQLYYSLLISAIFENTLYIPGHEKIYFFHLFLILTLLGTFMQVFKDKKILNILNKKNIIFYISWLIFMIISLSWAKSKSLGIKYLAIYLMMFSLVFIIMIFNRRKSDLTRTLKILGMMFLVAVAIGILEAVTGNQLPVRHYYNFTVSAVSPEQLALLLSRPIAFFYNSNNFATFIALALPFIFMLFYKEMNFKKKIGYYLWIVIALATVVITTSRSNLLAIIIVLIFYTLILLKEAKLKSLIYPLIIVVTFGFLYNYSFLIVSNQSVNSEKAMQKKISNMTKGTEIGGEGSENERATIMYDIVQGVFKEKKLLGFGVGNTTQYLMDRQNTHGIYSPHGLANEILGDFGVPFSIVYILYYLYLAYNLLLIGLKRNNSLKIISYSLLTALLGFSLGSFAPSSVTYFFPYWITLALAASVIQINTFEEKRSNNEQ